MEKKVEELKIELHSNVLPRTTYHFNTLEQSFKNNNINLVKCSMNLDKRIQLTEHPVLKAYYTAFLEHCPAIVSPDILWVLILEGFFRHMKLNSEKDIFNIKDKSLEQNIIAPNFSTTTEEIKVVCEGFIKAIIFQCTSSVERFMRTRSVGGCAFPYIKLQGTLQDYNQLKINIERLKGFLIDDWLDKLLSIVDKIIETKKGNIDKKFWDNMINNQKREYVDKLSKVKSDAHEAKKNEKIEIFGWIFDFFPFKKGTEIRRLNKDERIRLKDTKYNYIYENDYAYNSRYWEIDILIRNDIKIYEDPNFDVLPEEMIKIDNRDNINQKIEKGTKAGFFGYSLDEDHAFRPEIGWYSYVKNHF